MNKRGQVIFYTFMLAVIVIVLALALAFPVKQATDNARTAMNCSDGTTISMFDNATCFIQDVTPVYIIGGFIALAGIIFGAKILLQ